MVTDISFDVVFLGYVALIATVLAALLLRFLPRRMAQLSIIVLALWLVYAGILGATGIVANAESSPPGLLWLLGPILIFIALAFLRSAAGWHFTTNIPLWILIGLQTFRTGVELSLLELWHMGLAPKLLTLGGGNVEILIGVTAPIAAWASTKGANGRRFAFGWSILGLCSLLNVVTRAILTAPGPLNLIQAEVPNLAIGTFPFTFIPGFMAPLALALHILAFRAFPLRSGLAGKEYRSI